MASKPDVQCPQNIDAGPVFPYSVLFVTMPRKKDSGEKLFMLSACLSDCLNGSLKLENLRVNVK